MAPQDHASAKAHHSLESDHVVQVLSDARPPLKRQREEYPPPSSAPGHGPSTSEYYPRGGRPGANYPPSTRLSPSGPPSSASSSFYDHSAGPPPTMGSSPVTGGWEREYSRDRAEEYAAPPPGGAANSYERPRSPTGGGAGRAPMQSYGGRGGYSRPSDPLDRGYMPPPP